jgi:hypothetical protein
MATEQEVREVKRRHSAKLLSQPGVSGVGIERDESGDYVLAVHLDADAEDAQQELPEEIEGHRVRYVGSGPFRKQQSESSGSKEPSGSKKR